MSDKKRIFGTLDSGKAVELYTIINDAGAKAEVLTYGATLQSLYIPDKNGNFDDVTIGFDDLQGHLERSDYQGQTVGRYANRIAMGRFDLDGETFSLTKNEQNTTCLHSAGELSHALWEVESSGENFVELAYASPDGAHGFPGKVLSKVKYTLTHGNELIIDYYAVSDKSTVLNLTNHTYFNLKGVGKGDVLEHILQINADKFTPTDEFDIPTGELMPVEGTPFDFREPKPIGRDIKNPLEQLQKCRGFDHNFCLNSSGSETPAATVREPESGRVMEVFTDLPGVQLYTGNFLGDVPGKPARLMGKHSGFLLGDTVLSGFSQSACLPPMYFQGRTTLRFTYKLKFSVDKF